MRRFEISIEFAGMVRYLDYNNGHSKKGEEALEVLLELLEELKKAVRQEGMGGYSSYLHGQIYGLATALRIIYPGPGNIGEKAALAVRPVITEHYCLCEDKDSGY